MLRLLGKVLLLMVAAFSGSVALFWLLPIDRNQYHAAIIDKHERLESTKSPRIIFLGGSNLAFGLNSPVIEQELKLPVVNMGLQAGLGLRFMLEEVEQQLRTGDIVVLVPEYHQFLGLIDGEASLLDVLRLYPHSWGMLESHGQYLTVARQFPVYVQRNLQYALRRALGKYVDNPVYSRSLLNEHGDVVIAPGAKPGHDPRKLPLFSVAENTPVDDDAVREVARFAAVVGARGGSCYFMFPTIPAHLGQENHATLARIARSVGEINGCRVIGRPMDYTLPVDDFFDTVYHLRPGGIARRTRRTVDLLREAVAAAPDEHIARNERREQQ